MKELVKKIKGLAIYRMASRGDERSFYADLGWIFASREIRRELDGYPIDNDDDRRWLVAFRGDEAVAFRSYWVKGETGRFGDAWVAPPLRGNGIYSTLITLAIRDLAKSGAISVTAVANERSRPGLEKAGFAVVKPRGKKFFDMERAITEEDRDE